jgi:two-component system sensor histidine kinase ChvG
LINDISAASRLDAELSRIEIKEINISNLLETLVDIRSSTINSKINLLKHTEDVYISGDENKIAQVFDNLIQNATSFSKENNIINIRLEKNLTKIIIMVEDNGPGFSKGSLKKVFDRFYTDRPKKEKFGNHSGLGLSISKQIVEAHGGSIEALNRLNQRNKCLGGSVKVIFPEVKNNYVK